MKIIKVISFLCIQVLKAANTATAGRCFVLQIDECVVAATATEVSHVVNDYAFTAQKSSQVFSKQAQIKVTATDLNHDHT